MMRKIFLGCSFFVSCVGITAQNTALNQKIQAQLNDYFNGYTAKNTEFVRRPGLKTINVNTTKHKITIATNEYFAQQDFTEKKVGKIYKQVKHILPKPLNKYDLSIVTNGMPIEQYVPGYIMSGADNRALWGRIDYHGKPWVENVSRPIKITNGLQNRHLTVWSSHGRYYDNQKNIWKWQRPQLFGTTEDLFTQTIVIPYLIPMLEHAGAVVFTPRERDWQPAEYIIDRDGTLGSASYGYAEYADRGGWQDTGQRGFAPHAGSYVDGENPFLAGKARMMPTTKKAGKAYVKWQPDFAKGGRYAVYVSYQTLPHSVDDAHYTVFHKGEATEFRVNQKMGGGTWVYLGTFDFDKGDNLYNCVMLTNQSKSPGVVTADAVRFGGGMGNIQRGGKVSGYPRTLEGARYYAQWAGAPYNVYSSKNGKDDYGDDINARSRMLNWLAGGSVYVPHLEGKGIPMELSLAVHSDAGYAPNGKDLVGSLAICTTDHNDGRLDAGVSRQTSKLFAGELLSGLVRDLSLKYHQWVRRYLWDRNYSETRLPEVPSAILETMSHQNFPDMVMGQDPDFKFNMARSIYKTMARYVNDMHGRPTVIQPLAPQNIRVELSADHRANIAWTMQLDPAEPTAFPKYYVLYTAIGTGGFDNGRKVKGSSYSMKIEPGILYSFKVAAANRGGESFPSEVVSVYYQSPSNKNVLVVNGFHRLSAPAVIDNNTQQGFDLEADPGITRGATYGWCGPQLSFRKSRMGSTGPGGLGYSSNEWAGKLIAGNDFNYVQTHVEALAAMHKYNVVSCSSKAIENGHVKLRRYAAVDLLLGLERYNPKSLKYYQAFPQSLRERLDNYLTHGGRLLVSGAYIGADMNTASGSTWLQDKLKTSYATSVKTDSIDSVTGLNTTFDFYRQLNPYHYAAHHADVLQPVGQSIPVMRYSNGMSAATAYDGKDYKTFVMGFPFECITESSVRNRLMSGIMDFLLK